MKHPFKKFSQFGKSLGLLAILAASTILAATPASAEVPCSDHYYIYNSTTSTDPTCTDYGYRYGECPNCGAQTTVAIEPLGHAMTEWTTIVEETCSTEGTQFRHCTRCPHEEYQSIPAFGHLWTPWETTLEANCTRYGVRYRYCKSCAEEQYDTIDMSAHSWGNITAIRQATCTQRGAQRRTCSTCGQTETYETNYGSHAYTSWTTPLQPTAFSNGNRSRSCTTCGQSFSETLYPDGLLSNGSRNDAVKELQEALNQAGFDCGTADGIYGNKTAAAISAYEKSLELPEDGTGWPGIQDLLLSGLSIELITPVETLIAIEDVPVTLEFRITNTGTRKLFLHPRSMINETEEAEKDTWISDTSDWLAPGESIPYTLVIPTAEEDAAAGELYRSLTISAIPVSSMNVNLHQIYGEDLAQEDVTWEFFTGYEEEPKHLLWTEPLELRIPAEFLN